MPGILPEALAGGLVYRDINGNPTNPPNVENAYPPLPPFLANCAFTALPSDCTARIEAKQINAIVSEMLSFAECLDPNGPWDCNSLHNICTSFQTWAGINVSGTIYVGDNKPPNPEPNKLWWESDTGILYFYYNDGTSVQWVQVGGPTPRIVMDNVSIVGAGTKADPHRVGLIDCGSW